MRIDLEPRPKASRTREILAPVVALFVAIVIGGLVVVLLGKPPVQAFRVYFVDPLTEGWSLQALAVKASPLVLIAVGLSFCFRANLWNIGAEGQFIAGGLFGGWLGIVTHGGSGGVWILPTMLLLGAFGGLLYAMLPAVLKVWLGVSEILTSLMLVYVAQLGLDYMVRGPWRDPLGFNFPVSVNFDADATLPLLVEGGRLHAGVAVTLAVLAIASLVLSRTLFGFEVRLVGDAPKAARFAGFNDQRLTLAVFAISGACAGLAGISEVAGQIGQLQPSISPGYGFTAITVAFLGRLSPFGILIAGMVLALTYIGGEAAQVALKLPLDMTMAFQGILLMCVLGADVFTRYQIRLVGRTR
jgi:general nucleoside transport system permease protein